MEKLKGFFGALLILAGILTCVLYPFGYWVLNPSLTEMQLFLKFWWIWTLGIMSVLFGLGIIGDNE